MTLSGFLSIYGGLVPLGFARKPPDCPFQFRQMLFIYALLYHGFLK